jgi:oligopeptidase B
MKAKRHYLLLIGGLFALAFANKVVTNMTENQTLLEPPVARKIPKDVTVHGDPRIDNYFWLRERENPEVLEYLKAENAYTDAVMKHTEALQESLYQEMKGRIKETDLSVPVKIDDYYYYNRTEAGQQYPIYCRKYGSLEAEEEVLLDQNELARGYDYFRLGVLEVSPNHRLLAYAVDTTGGEEFKLFVKDLETGKLLPDVIPQVSYSLEWANDNRTFFYTTLDPAKRPFKVFRHVLGTDAEDDQLVFHEPDEAYFVYVGKSKSKEYLFLTLESNITTEVRYLKADDPFGTFQVIHPREEGMEYSVAHNGDWFYILTNDQAINFRLMKAPVSEPDKEHWTEVIPHRENVKIDYIEMFRDFLVVFEKENGLKRIRVTRLEDGDTHYVDFPEPVYTISRGNNPEFTARFLRFNYASLITPRTVFDYDLEKRTRELKKQEEVLGGYDPNVYESKRLWATAPDGVKVPMSLVYRKGIRLDGQNPLYLYGYGSYGATIDPYFSSNRFSLIDRGFVYVIAHVRGGGYLGRPWYEDGKLLHKRNTFTDFIACAEHLIQEGYTNPDKLVISGGSAGGLLMGAVTNMRPDLFKAVVARVPFVDVINTMLDESIPLTVTEYDEWGNPHEKEYYDYIRTYSPYDNVEAKAYPNILVTAGLNDARVQYWEPAKWVAKLRDLKTDDNLVLLKTNMGAGHSGRSGRYEYLREVAFRYAFILDILGFTE